MSVFDVHINRAPIGGTIRDVVYISGKFVNADLDKASDENERQHVLIEGNDGTILGMTQIAGLVARRKRAGAAGVERHVAEAAGALVGVALGEGGAALFHLGLSKHGHPRHPLYIAYARQPEIWLDA